MPEKKDDMEMTELLAAWSRGEDAAMKSLMPALYDQLREMAHRHLRRGGDGRAFDTTELVHEAFARLQQQREIAWQSRRHFLGVCSVMMRRILVDEARARLAEKRGHGAVHVPLDESDAATAPAREIIALNDSLTRLEKVSPTQGCIVMLRIFAGLSVQETADALGCSRGTVIRHWRLAKAWLYRDLRE